MTERHFELIRGDRDQGKQAQRRTLLEEQSMKKLVSSPWKAGPGQRTGWPRGEKEAQGLPECEPSRKHDEVVKLHDAVNQEKWKRMALEERLQEKEGQLKKVSRDLEEAYTTLKILSSKILEERDENGDRLLFNLKYEVLPCLDRLKARNLDDLSRKYCDLVESRLRSLIAMINPGSLWQLKELTPTEIQVADLVRNGKSTKEISSILCISDKCVEFHRNNIRGKLGLKGKKICLKRHLSTLSLSPGRLSHP
jgi:DNA-binding CsgD family transcriptional regulator